MSNHEEGIAPDPQPVSRAVENMMLYPQLCGLCGCIASAHTPDHCKQCGRGKDNSKAHQYVRADVFACTLLNQAVAGLAGMYSLLQKQNAILERIAPDPKKPRLIVPLG